MNPMLSFSKLYAARVFGESDGLPYSTTVGNEPVPLVTILVTIAIDDEISLCCNLVPNDEDVI